MDSVKKISANIAIYLKDKLNLEEEKYEVIEYGLHGFFNMIVSVLFIILFGSIFGTLWESVLISFAGAILRKSSGGAHASKELNCIIIGVIVSLIPAIVFVNSDFNIINTIIFISLMFLVSTLLVYKLAPVDSANKPIKSEKKIKRLKKGSLITLGIYMTLVITNVLLSIKFNYKNLIIYSLCISFGALWQSFTLTKLGHIVLNLLDSFFIKVLGSKEEI